MKIPVLAYIAMVSSVFPIVSGLLNWKRIDQPLRFFFYFLVVTSLQIGTEYILGRYKIQTQSLSDVYTVFEVAMLLSLFQVYITSPLKKNTLIAFTAAVIFIYAFSVTPINQNPQFNTALSISARIVLIISSIIVIHQLVESSGKGIVKIQESPLFWIASGVLVYCSGSIVVLSMGNEILKMGLEYFFAVWYFNWIFFIFGNILFCRAFIVQRV